MTGSAESLKNKMPERALRLRIKFSDPNIFMRNSLKNKMPERALRPGIYRTVAKFALLKV